MNSVARHGAAWTRRADQHLPRMERPRAAREKRERRPSSYSCRFSKKPPGKLPRQETRKRKARSSLSPAEIGSGYIRPRDRNSCRQSSALTLARHSRIDITEEPFECTNGNVQGYAKPAKNIIAVSPIAYDRLKTAFHEIGHVKLHADMVSMHAPDALPRDVREVEAETVSYLVCSALDHTENLHYSRGYIKNWIGEGTVEKVRFGKVFATADAVLKAGDIEPDLVFLTSLLCFQ